MIRKSMISFGLVMSGFSGIWLSSAAGADVQHEAVSAKPSLTGADVAAPLRSAATQSARGGNPISTIPLNVLDATRERPLFSPSRRPPPKVEIARDIPPPPPSKPVKAEKPPLVLRGTVLGDSGESFGLFVSLPDLKNIRLRLGEDHHGWVLRDVKNREVMLEKETERAMLELPKQSVAAKSDGLPPTSAIPAQPAPLPKPVAQPVPPQPAPIQPAMSQPAPPPPPPQPAISQTVPPQLVAQGMPNPMANPAQSAPPINPFAGILKLR